MGTISDSHQIDQEAQIFLRSCLTANQWIIREDKPEYHLDYVIEVAQDGEPSGRRFGIQLKGTRIPDIQGRLCRFRLKTKHLKYYVDRQRLPVFLVVVNIEGGEGYWLFTQGFAHQKLKGKNWREKKTVTLKIPMTNRLTDSSALLEAVEEAERFMKNLRPGSIAAAIREEIRRLRFLDPRFDVDMEVKGGTQIYNILPRTAVEGSMSFGAPNSENLANRIRELKRGQSVTFRGDEIGVGGLPLIRDLLDRAEDGTVNVEISRVIPVAASILSLTSTGEEASAITDIDGQIVIGIEEACLHAAIPGSPFSVDVAFQNRPESSSSHAKLDFCMDYSVWGSQKLKMLAYFDKIRAIFTGLRSGNTVQIVCSKMGNDCLSISCVSRDLESFLEQQCALLDLIDMMRGLARYYEVDPMFSGLDELANHNLDLMTILHGLLENDTYRVPASGFRMGMRLTIGSYYRKQIMQGEIDVGSVRFTFNPAPLPLFGAEICPGPLSIELTKPSLCTDLAALRQHIRENPDDPTEVVWEGSEDSEFLASKGRGDK